MRNTLLALLGSSLLVSLTTVRADQTLADATQNFGPARPAGAEAPAAEQPAATTPTPPPAPPVVKPPPPAPTVDNSPAVTPAPAATAPAPAPVVVATGNPEAVQSAREETIRRQALQSQARALIDEGRRFYLDGKYEQAIVKLEEAIKILPRAKATAIDYSLAIQALGDSYVQVGDKAFRVNDRKTAMEDARRALAVDPSNRAAENLLVKVKQADRDALVQAARKPAPPEPLRADNDPVLTAKKDEIHKLFREGKILLNSGQYDDAERTFRQVLLVDPYNEDAQEYLRAVSEARGPSTEAGINAAREHTLWLNDNAWLPPLGGDTKMPLATTTATSLPGGSANQTIIQKLNDIKFPEIKFREASLSDVVNYLSEESRKIDPAREGVNIVLGPGISGGEAGAPAAAPAPAPALGDAPAPAPAAGGSGRSITLSLKNVPMIEALKYVVSLANLKYRVESSAVLILPLDAPDQQMITKTYPVTPGIFQKMLAAPGAAGAGAAAGGGGAGGEFRGIGEGTPATVTTVDLKALFADAGVSFPAGSSITLNERTSTVFIHNTPDNIEAFERVLPNFDAIPLQVEIEAKFIEISQTDLDELGFNWSVGQYSFGSFAANGGSPSTLFGSGGQPNPAASSDITSGLRDSSGIAGDAIQAALGGSSAAAGGAPGQVATLQGILTNPQFQLVIKALSQKASSDVLSAPKVTTLSGIQAQIKVVDEFIYPSEYTEPQVAAGGGGVGGGNGAAAITPTIPSAFKTREVGVILNVTPTVGADKYTISLALTPEVSEFLGFLDYSPGNVTSAGTGTNGTGGASVPFKIQQPLFSTRSLSTSVVIWDGQTVVLGGLIKTTIAKIDDKVPFLGDIPLVGRLFRSKATERTKDNLLIFVTARLIDPAGQPLHKQLERGSH